MAQWIGAVASASGPVSSKPNHTSTSREAGKTRSRTTAMATVAAHATASARIQPGGFTASSPGRAPHAGGARRRRRRRVLHPVQAGVHPVARQELAMRAHLAQLAAMEDEDAVGA